MVPMRLSQPAIASSSLLTVVNIVLRRSGVEMTGIAARGIVASVKNERPLLRGFSARKAETGDVSPLHFTALAAGWRIIYVHHAVAVIIKARRPRPALVRTSLVNLWPEAVRQGDDFVVGRPCALTRANERAESTLCPSLAAHRPADDDASAMLAWLRVGLHGNTFPIAAVMILSIAGMSISPLQRFSWAAKISRRTFVDASSVGFV